MSHPATRLRRLSPIALFALTACIEPRQMTTPPDAPDTASTEDVGTSEDVGTAEDVGPSCEELACANTDTPCQTATCRDGRCVTEPADGWCGAASQCGGPEVERGLCVDGECVVRTAGCESTGTKGCVVPVCGPGANCVEVPVEGGFCLATVPQDLSACEGTRMKPIDICDAEGQCRRRSVDNSNLPDMDLLDEPTWWVVSQRLGTATARTFASRFNFETDGKFSSTRFGRPLGEIGIEAERGTFCLDPAGGLAIRLTTSSLGLTDDIRLIGQVARHSQAIAGTSTSGRELMLGIAMGTDRTRIHGAYEALMTRAAGVGGISVWRGSMTFESGDLQEFAFFEGTGGGYAAFAPDGSSVGEMDRDTGLFRLTLAREVGDDQTEDDAFVGAVSPDGRMALFAALDGEDRPGFGMLVLMRIDGGAEEMPAAPERAAWYAASQGSAGGDDWFSAGAMFVTRGDRVLQGLHGDGGEVWTSTRIDGRIRGGQLAWNKSGQLGAELRISGTARFYSGFMTKNRDLGLIVGVPDRASMTLGPSFSGMPVIPEFAFIVRRNE